jgi:TfoX/Sxy family transcriptional regulator of competence genes
MAYDENVAQRVRDMLDGIPGVTEKKMFGGIAFMVNGNMCSGVVNRELMMRVGAEQYKEALSQPYARPMDFTGKPMKGFVYVSAKGFETDDSLKSWIERSLLYVGNLPVRC